MKKLSFVLCVLLLAALLVCAFPSHAQAASSGTCGESVTWTLDDAGTLTISGSGTMEDYASASASPWYSQRTSVKTIVIEDGVTSIGDRAFYNCTALTDVTISESVLTIGTYAFRGCMALAEVTIPANVTELGGSAFRACTALTVVTFGGDAPALGNYVFNDGAASLTVQYYEGSTGYDVPPWTNYTLSAQHVGEWVVDIVPTCTSDGTRSFYCLYCPFSFSDTIPATGHNYVDGCCTACKDAQIVKGGFCGADVQWKLDALGNLTIWGSGQMEYISSSDGVPWYSDRNFIKTVIVESGVTSIANFAFAHCSGLTSIAIPETVFSIGTLAFSDCGNLSGIWVAEKNAFYSSDENGVLYDKDKLNLIQAPGAIPYVMIPNSVIRIESSAFEGCSSLTSITIPDSVISIGDCAFSACTSLTGIWLSENNNNYSSDGYGMLYNKDRTILIRAPGAISCVTIPDSVTHIGRFAFEGCINLNDITIPNSVTRVDDHAFEGCTNLNSIIIPDSVTSIGEWAFYNCSSLTCITIPNSVTCIENATFWCCSSLNSITIPDSVTSIGEWAFYNCSGLSSVTIPEGITSIGNYAFWRCSGLISANIPESITSIGDYVFRDCSSLTEITIPDSVISIGEDAFSGCYSLLTITIPESVTSIGKGAFRGCRSFTDITIPDSITSIADYLFSDCYSLTSITIPNSVTSIGKCAFRNCNNLVNTTIPNGVSSIANSVFEGCANLISVNIPQSVTSIGEDAFYRCKKLSEITIPDGTTSIGENAFYGCSSLTSIIIPDGITSIGISVFSGCSGLTHVTIPQGLTSIGDSAFSGCSNLTKVFYCGTESQKANISISTDNMHLQKATWHYEVEVNETDGKSTIYCPDCDCYYNCPRYGSCGENLTWTLDDEGNLTISGTGAMEDYDWLESIWCSDSSIKTIVIQNGVTTIGNNAFAMCKNMVSVIIPDSVKSIGHHAFYECGSLIDVTFPNQLTSIGSASFALCESLKTATLPDSVSNLGSYAFWCCTNLTSVTIGSGLTIISDSSFASCSNLESINIPDCVICIGDYAFELCSSLKSITIPHSVNSIGMSAFVGCSGLTSVNIPDSVIEFGDHPFCYCENLTGIWVDENNASYSSDANGALFNKDGTKLIQLPGAISGQYTIADGVISIGAGAFAGCESLTGITIPNSVIKFEEAPFEECTSLKDVYYSGDLASWCSLVFDSLESNPMTCADSLYISGQLLTGTIVIPESVTSIRDYVFYNCYDFTAIAIPESITSIGSSAFYYCDRLDKVFYRGTEKQKASIAIGSNNSKLTNATWHYEVMDAELNGIALYHCGKCGSYFNLDGTEYVPLEQPTLTGKSFSLSFEDEILVNFYYTAEKTDDVVEQGMLVFYADPGAADIAKADDVYTGSATDGTVFANTTHGIAAKYMGDSRYYCAYAKLANGGYAYSKLYQYSPKKYAMNMLGKDSTSEKQKALCVAMLNYGAAAQNFFGYKTDALMNSELTDEQKALVMAYDETLFTGAVPADSGKIGSFTKTATGFSARSASVSFEGAFSINYYFTPSVAVNGEVTLYYWTPEDFAAADVLTVDNASGSSAMVAADGNYWGQVSGIAAKKLDDTYYVAGVYTNAEGNTYCTGVIAYSLSKYCLNNAKPGKSMQELASATAMYGYYANAYFN